jgi:hypothetical protein
MAIGPNGIEVKTTNCTNSNPYGLLSVVQPTNNIDPHWQVGGLLWEDFLCSPGVVGFIDVCPPASGFTKPSDRTTQFCRSDPFVLVGSYKCPPVGRPADEAYEIARQRLLKWEERQLEEILWTGVIDNGSGFVNPSFAFGNDECDIVPEDLNPAGAVDIVRAVSLIEEALGNTSGCGIIHAPGGLAAYLKFNFLVEKDNGTYYSPQGYPIVIGNGYPGSGPGNTPANSGELWLFATGPMVLAKSNMLQVPDNIAEGVNRMVNDIEIRAERFYSVGFSCALFAVRVELCDSCGGP